MPDARGPFLEPYDLISLYYHGSKPHAFADKKFKSKASGMVRKLYDKGYLTREPDDRYNNPRFWKYRLIE